MESIEENYDDIEDETLIERLWGLTEMFPEPIRNLSSSLVVNSFKLTKTFYTWSRVGLWVAGSTFTVLLLPVLCEQERFTMEEQEVAQQRQLLLGPSATVSAPNVLPGMPVPASK